MGEQLSLFERESRHHVIFFSGGNSSFAVADYVKEKFPNDNIVLLFQDVKWEDPDLYRFIKDASDRLQLPLLTHSAGLSPIELMFEKKLLFNSMIGDCSKILKMKVASDFIKKGIEPPVVEWRNKHFLKDENFRNDPILYFGIDFMEAHRIDSITKNWAPFRVQAPLIDNFVDVDEVLDKYNIKRAKLYDLGFSHNNCGGRCVKAGHQHYKLLLKTMPERFKDIMEKEHHLKVCVSAYRYITNEKVEDPLPKDVQEIMLQELDDAYRDYFYGRTKKPKLYIHPGASSSHPEDLEMKQYAFMKKSYDGVSIPYPIRELKYDVEGPPFESYSYPGYFTKQRIEKEKERKRKAKNNSVLECTLDESDLIGGCGCFFDYSENQPEEEIASIF
ncbi:hypothetical protein J2S74_002926 [Evansella vedderi]|uniref:Phosphoadenosine phosphosulphate reductase domain-containing protein n=1 Tax=Evansella vedderi TaxID=38282 RepID=A0ABT9ZWE1_9BACI|nr:phosphoadenosine phosphosulfate reductase family protein [Evansella vedderi]MDQ0255544.1 hypothetical protein [Evansella vedderi]